MRDINLKDLIDLVTEEVENSNQELKSIYDWYHNRELNQIKVVIGFGITLFIGLIISYVKEDIKNDYIFILSLLSSISIIATGVINFFQLRNTSRNYIAALALLKRLEKIKPFLIKYKEHKIHN